MIRDAKILLGRRAHFRKAYPNCWDFIGGKIETGETAPQALTRELGEEIAVSPIDPSYFDKITDIHANAENPPVYHFFKVHEWREGDPVINNFMSTPIWSGLRCAKLAICQIWHCPNIENYWPQPYPKPQRKKERVNPLPFNLIQIEKLRFYTFLRDAQNLAWVDFVRMA